jgi:hypothetical protein
MSQTRFYISNPIQYQDQRSVDIATGGTHELGCSLSIICFHLGTILTLNDSPASHFTTDVPA